MAEEKDAEAIPDERMARRIDEDPEFEEAKALLRGLVAKSPNPHLPEERLRVNEELLELIDVPHLSALALAH